MWEQSTSKTSSVSVDVLLPSMTHYCIKEDDNQAMFRVQFLKSDLMS